MKKYFYFLRDAESTDPNMVVYKVSVGQSEREQAKYFLTTLIPSLYQISLPKKYHPVCKPEPRPYLSRLRENSFYSACFGMAIVAALFILQSIIDGMEASLY